MALIKLKYRNHKRSKNALDENRTSDWTLMISLSDLQNCGKIGCYAANFCQQLLNEWNYLYEE